jgi:hypothetical protein
MEPSPAAARWTLNRIIALILAGGFLFLMADTRLEHASLMARKPLVFIPMIFSALGFLIALLAAFRWKPAVVKLLLVVSLLAIPVGLGGLWFHNEDRIGEGENAPQTHARQTPPAGELAGEPRPGEGQQFQGEERPGGDQPAGDRQRIEPERKPRRRGPPILAPAAFLGMGLLGTLVALRRWPGDLA